MIRTLSGKNKDSTISVDITNESLLEKAYEKLKSEDEVTLIHDPSDIRKPHSKDAEDLGKVRDLKGRIINGYSTHNIIALPSKAKEVILLSNKTYSNKSNEFLSQENIKKIEDGKEFEGRAEAQKLYDCGKYFNKKTLSKDEITASSTGLKKENSGLRITHVLDREFDDNDYIHLISNNLKDDFVIRSKKTRTLNEKDDGGKKIKLIESDFVHHGDLPFQKLQIKNKVIQDGKIRLEWRPYNDIAAVKVTIIDRKGNNVFDDSMLLLTNKIVSNLTEAYAVYKKYLQRSKIEYVFKFLKEGLGWEEMQIKDFQAIKNLLSLCFYVAAYLYEIGDETAHDDYAVILADLGGGKGKVTRHFILEGIKILCSHYKYEVYIKKNGIPYQTEKVIKDSFSIGL